jgi:Leucine-rich repeat (LRR) protein
MRIMTTFKVLLLMVAVAALALNSPPISAQSVPPHIFTGSATVNGLHAPSDTTITAMIDGEAKGSAIVGTNGEYGPLLVYNGDNTIITFQISSLLADQIALWQPGGATILDLAAWSFSTPPHIFVGTTSFSGIAAPTGTIVTAWNERELWGAAEVGANGSYGPMQVKRGSTTTITFQIGNFAADQTAVWEQGGATLLNLTAAPPSFDCSVVNSVPGEECEALLSLYNSTAGPNWTNKTDWLATTTPCSWYGITCSGDRVTIISLTENQLTRAIPLELGNLGNLQSLDLSGNQLAGSIPMQLANLANLEYLNLGNNYLTGSIPIELANLASLQYLILNKNQLTGSIQIELANLLNLQSLDLGFNQLTGSIPIELANLANLQSLDLSSNQLTGSIPPDLANLASLQGLHLGNNQLTGSIPPELANLANLQQLLLNGNRLTGSIPIELANLANLQSLDLQDNQINGAIPPKLANLQDLTLSGNQLTGSIPVELANLANLHDLNLSSNQLTGSVPVELANLVSLQSLFLVGNQLTGAIPVELANLASLQDLFLNGNQLTGSIPIELANLTNLQYLVLSGNQLTGSIPIELANLANLQHLGLDGNQLTGNIPIELANLANLQYLGLSGNDLTGSIPIELGNLASLQYLYLHSNQLTGSIPLTLTNLNLSVFWFHETNLCEPSDLSFQTWLTNISGLRSGLRSTGVRCISVEFVWPVIPDDRELDGDGNGISGDYAHYGEVVSDKHHVGLDTLTGPGANALAALAGHVFMIQENGGNLAPNIPCHEPLLPNESSYCEDHGYGNTVIIEHSVPTEIDPGGKIYTHYSHLESIRQGLITGCRAAADPNREKRRTCDNIIDVAAGEPIGQVGSTCYGVDCTVRHLHFEMKTFPTLAAISNDCCDFGYTTQHPDDLGYFDPLRFLHDIPPILPDTISVGNRVGITNSGQGVGLRMGPGKYTRLGRVNAGQQFVARRTGPATVDPSCSMGWYQVFKTENPISPPLPDDYFTEITGGKTPDAWVCRGNAGEAWVGSATQTGLNIQVAPTEGVSVAFQQIAGQGITSVDLSASNPGTVSGIQFLGTFYDVITTADYTGTVTVCLDYDASGMAQSKEEKLRVFHWDGLSWLDVTASLDTGNDNICATVPSLSWFAIGEVQPIGNIGEPSFDLYQDPTDGATGFKVDITRVFDSSTNEDVSIGLRSFQAGLTYPDASANPAFPPGTLALAIAQYLTGLRDEFYNLIP